MKYVLREKSENLQQQANKIYTGLYNQLVTQILILPLLFLQLKTAYKLIEADQKTKSLEDIYQEIDSTLEQINRILQQMIFTSDF